MTSYVPPIKNGAGGWIGYVGLSPRTATGAFQSNPTLAAGDVKVSIDGGALTNLGTLPAVTPASSKMVKITLSQAEVNGDNITIVFSDAAGAEWCDLIINLQTVARQLDDLAFPNTSGRGIDVSAGGEVGLDWANIGSPTTAQNLSGTNIDVDQVVASVSGAVGSVTGAVGSVTAGVTLAASAVQAIWDALTSALTTVGSIGKKLADWTIGTAQTGDSFARLGAPAGASVSADIAAIKVDTAATLVDTAEIGVAGAGLTNINLPNQTMDITGNITGNLSGSVGSVTGAVGSVTGGVTVTTNNDKTGYALSAAGVDAIHDEVIDDTLTHRQSMRLVNSALHGELAGANTTSVTIRDVADTKARITATVDASGNRTAITRDAT